MDTKKLVDESIALGLFVKKANGRYAVNVDTLSWFKANYPQFEQHIRFAEHALSKVNDAEDDKMSTEDRTKSLSARAMTAFRASGKDPQELSDLTDDQFEDLFLEMRGCGKNTFDELVAAFRPNTRPKSQPLPACSIDQINSALEAIKAQGGAAREDFAIFMSDVNGTPIPDSVTHETRHKRCTRASHFLGNHLGIALNPYQSKGFKCAKCGRRFRNVVVGVVHDSICGVARPGG